MNPGNGRFADGLEQVCHTNVCFSSGALSCAVMNSRSLLGLKNELDKFWNNNHWMGIEMDTELLHAKTFWPKKPMSYSQHVPWLCPGI